MFGRSNLGQNQTLKQMRHLEHLAIYKIMILVITPVKPRRIVCVLGRVVGWCSDTSPCKSPPTEKVDWAGRLRACKVTRGLRINFCPQQQKCHLKIYLTMGIYSAHISRAVQYCLNAIIL